MLRTLFRRSSLARRKWQFLLANTLTFLSSLLCHRTSNVKMSMLSWLWCAGRCRHSPDSISRVCDMIWSVCVCVCLFIYSVSSIRPQWLKETTREAKSIRLNQQWKSTLPAVTLTEHHGNSCNLCCLVITSSVFWTDTRGHQMLAAVKMGKNYLTKSCPDLKMLNVCWWNRRTNRQIAGRCTHFYLWLIQLGIWRGVEASIYVSSQHGILNVWCCIQTKLYL